MDNISEKHKKLAMLIQEECKKNDDFKALMEQSFLYPYIEANLPDSNKKSDFCCQGSPMQQAEEFYKDFTNLFPKELLIALKSDFIKMLFNQRTNNFSDFSIACYQQIENILNFLLSSKNLRQYLIENIDENVYTGLLPPYDKNNPLYGPLALRNLIFNNTDSNKKYLQDSTIRFEEKTYFLAKEKAIIALHFYIFKDKNSNQLYRYTDIKNLYKKIEYIYQGRNSVHRDIHRQEEIDKIFPNKSQSYFKMLGYFEDFIYELKTGIQRLIQINQSKKESAITEATN